MTTLYLMRHSKSEKGNIDSRDTLQVQNEKYYLSLEGKKLAEEKSKYFNNIDVIYASNYVRAIETAEYIARKNNLEINIDSELGERKFGFNSWSDKPDDFERKQFLDENYKFGNGESQKEVRERMYKAIIRIVDDNKGKRIVVVSHATAISYLLKTWCSIELVDDKLLYKYKDKVLLHGYLDNCELFKLEFDDNNNLIDINNVKEL
jgi:broad specificity phosphatase PhoE